MQLSNHTFTFHSISQFIFISLPSRTIIVVQSLNHVRLFAIPYTAVCRSVMVLHHHLEFAQTHVHLAHDAIQTSHPLSPSSPPALNLSQNQGLFQ